MLTHNSRLQFITHYTEKYSYVDSARIALEGGCRWIQLRMKDADASTLEETALIVQKMCKDYGATFIIDDHVSLVKKIKADGVHLGKNDMPIAEARQLLGDSFIIGGTVNSLEDVLATLQSATPDYFGCGPFRFTSTKKNLAPILGHEGSSIVLAHLLYDEGSLFQHRGIGILHPKLNPSATAFQGDACRIHIGVFFRVMRDKLQSGIMG